MNSEEFIKKYNALLQREIKAEAYLTNDKVSVEAKEKWIPEFLKIERELSQMIHEYKKITGSDMPTEEILNGYSPKTRQN